MCNINMFTFSFCLKRKKGKLKHTLIFYADLKLNVET